MGDDEPQRVSNYELLTGKNYPLDSIRMRGAPASGTMLPEQRKGLRLDKAGGGRSRWNIYRQRAREPHLLHHRHRRRDDAQNPRTGMPRPTHLKSAVTTYY